MDRCTICNAWLDDTSVDDLDPTAPTDICLDCAGIIAVDLVIDFDRELSYRGLL